jgi:hypothetical protein
MPSSCRPVRADEIPERPPDTLRRYATDAGFTSVDVLPVQDDFFRFYRLVQQEPARQG